MKKPALKFSKWIRWENRENFPKGRQPGVYMLAITKRDLGGKRPILKETSYIGMTNSKSGLFLRWQQIDNTIQKKDGKGASSGKSIRTHYGIYSKWPRGLKLFVCACAIECNTDKKKRTSDDLIKMGWIRFLEYEALSRFKKQMGKEPEFNIQ